MNHMNKNTLLVRRLNNQIRVSLKSTFVCLLTFFKPEVNTVAENISLGRYKCVGNWTIVIPLQVIGSLLGLPTTYEKLKEILLRFASNSYKLRRNGNRKWRWSFALNHSKILGSLQRHAIVMKFFRGSNVGRAFHILWIELSNTRLRILMIHHGKIV